MNITMRAIHDESGSDFGGAGQCELGRGRCGVDIYFADRSSRGDIIVRALAVVEEHGVDGAGAFLSMLNSVFLLGDDADV